MSTNQFPIGTLVRTKKNNHWYGRDAKGKETEAKLIPKGTLARVKGDVIIELVVPVDGIVTVPILITKDCFEPVI